jgi:hypothetical protein
LHIFFGTNGADKPDAIEVAVQARRDMIRLLRDHNPRVVVAIGLPFQDWKPFSEMRDAYRMLPQRNSSALPK